MPVLSAQCSHMHKHTPHTGIKSLPLRELPIWTGGKKWKQSEEGVSRKKNQGKRKAHVAEGDSHLQWNQLILQLSHPTIPQLPSFSIRVLFLTTYLYSFFNQPYLLLLPPPLSQLSLLYIISPSLFPRPRPPFVTVGELRADRHRQHTLMLLYLTRRIFSCYMHGCTLKRKDERRRGHGYTRGKDSAQKCTRMDKHGHTLGCVQRAGITNIATHTRASAWRQQTNATLSLSSDYTHSRLSRQQ